MKNTPLQELVNLINKLGLQSSGMMKFQENDYKSFCELIHSKEIQSLANATFLSKEEYVLLRLLKEQGQIADIPEFIPQTSIDIVDLFLNLRDSRYLMYFHPRILLHTKVCNALVEKIKCDRDRIPYYDTNNLPLNKSVGAHLLEDFETRFFLKYPEYVQIHYYFEGKEYEEDIYLLIESAIKIGTMLGVPVKLSNDDEIAIFLKNVEVYEKTLVPNFMNMFFQEDIFLFSHNHIWTSKGLDKENAKHLFAELFESEKTIL